jgi:hypothetical protein
LPSTGPGHVSIGKPNALSWCTDPIRTIDGWCWPTEVYVGAIWDAMSQTNHESGRGFLAL